jgi:hypothetical protein
MKKVKLIKLTTKNGVKKFMKPKTKFNYNAGFGFGGDAGVGALPNSSKQSKANMGELARFRANKEKIVGPIITEHLKSNRKDVLHGSRSLSMIIPHYSRKPKDWDIYSTTHKAHARSIEKKIDKKVGADVVETVYRKIPKVTSGPDPPGTAKEIYIVQGKQHGVDIADVANMPKGQEKFAHKDITHERLSMARAKAERRARLQPSKSAQAYSDIRDIDRYQKRKQSNYNWTALMETGYI